jgi:hypothetical protein
MRRQVSFWVFVMLIAGLLVWALSPVVGFAFVDWDDRHYIVESVFTRHPFSAGLLNFLTTPWYGYPIPLVSLSWAVDARVSGGEPWSFHLTNLLLHLGNTALVFGVARGWGRPTADSGHAEAPERLIAAALAAGLWALHPVVAEPVSWCIGRKDLLCTGAALLSVLGSRLALAQPGAGWRWLRWLAFAAALGAKPTGVVVPLLWLLDSRVRGAGFDRSLLREAGMALVVSLGFAVGSFSLLGDAGGLSATSRPERLLFAMRHLSLQAEHYLLPLSLAPRYFMATAGVSALVAAIAGVALWLAPALAVWRRGWSEGSGGLLWVAVCFLPVAGLIGMNRGPADSYFYLPSVGLWLAALPLLRRIALRASGRLGSMVLLCVMAASLRWQSGIWSDSESLWQRQVEVAPEVATSWWSLADVYAASGRPREAVAVYEYALKVVAAPLSPAPYLEMSRGCLLASDRVCATHWLTVAETAFPGRIDVALRRVGMDLLGGATLATADPTGVVSDWLRTLLPSGLEADYGLVDDDAAALAALRASAGEGEGDVVTRPRARALLEFGFSRMKQRSGATEAPLPL